MGILELGPGQRRMPEVGTSLEAGLARGYRAEVCIVQIASRQVRLAQVRVFEAGTPKIRATKIRTGCVDSQ
jgi:hypothetical protein